MRDRAILLKVAATAVALAVVGYLIEPSLLIDGLVAVGEDPSLLVLALVVYGAGFGLRAIAWAKVLPVAVPFFERLRALFAMIAVNHVVPGPAGEVIRARFIRRDSLEMSRSLASVAAARAADVAALGLLASVSAVLLGQGPAWIVGGLGIGLATPAIALALTTRIGLPLGPLEMSRATAWAIPGWAAESVLVLVVASAAGFDLSMAEATFALCAAVLSKAVAVLPGGIGTFEAAMAGGLAVSGIPTANGLAIAATTHAVLFGFAFAVGGPALLSGLVRRRHIPQGTFA